MLCGDLNEKEIQERGDICVRRADSLCCTAGTNTTLESNYVPPKNNFTKSTGLNKKGHRVGGGEETVSPSSLLHPTYLGEKTNLPLWLRG